MSNFKGHLEAGVIVSVPVAVTSYFLSGDWYYAISVTLLTVFGSLLPDVDTCSIPSRWVARVCLLLIGLSWYYGLNIYGLIIGSLFCLMKSGTHRGLSHRYIIPLGIFGVAMYYKFYFLTGLSIGLCVHYFKDKIYPFNPKNWF